MIKKIAFPIKKKKGKEKSASILDKVPPKDFHGNYIAVAARTRRRLVSGRSFDLFQCTRPDACVSVEPDEESVIIVTSMR